MQRILFDYQMNPTTWVYLSSLLIIGIYFKFNRLWSLRNLDLLGLIAFSPGLLMIYHGLAGDVAGWIVQFGYVWLFSVSAFFLVRMLLDLIMVRRPLLEPNLSAGGLTFTAFALVFFLMANVISPNAVQRLEHVLSQQEEPAERGPGYRPFYTFATISKEAIRPVGHAPPQNAHRVVVQAVVSRSVAIAAHVAILLGLMLIGYWHFDNLHTGVAVVALYLLLPYTSQMTGRIDHVLPGALLVWTAAAYRRPIIAGVLLGLAAIVYYPLFLLPLWCSFYWRRGVIRFAIGVLISIALLILGLLISAESTAAFVDQLREMFGWMSPLREDLTGFWAFHESAYRIPVLAAFMALSGSFALWPAQKNLGTLLSCSAAIMLATQFWHAHQGGLCMAWYLPLMLLTIFRPNLEDRVAITTVSPSWMFWRRIARG